MNCPNIGSGYTLQAVSSVIQPAIYFKYSTEYTTKGITSSIRPVSAFGSIFDGFAKKTCRTSFFVIVSYSYVRLILQDSRLVSGSPESIWDTESQIRAQSWALFAYLVFIRYRWLPAFLE